MDNPQPYQPLSHALHPPSTANSRSIYPPIHHQYSHQPQSIHPLSTQKQPLQSSSRISGHEEEEEEEEEDDDEDEGIVEDQLNQNDPDLHGSNSSSPRPSGSGDHRPSQSRSAHGASTPPVQKRGPGRPRGSKNRRPRVGSAKHEAQFQYTPQSSQPPTSSAAPAPAPPSSTGPPSHPNINPQNEQYYDFQWRVLTLCAEFYGAAEELIKKTPLLVVAQCYHMGPSAKVDPLTMLADAKRICDTLLANPSQLVTNPPPPIYPVLPTTVYQPISTTPVPQPTPSTSTATATPTPAVSVSAPQPNLITNPQSFIVPLVGQAPPYPQYPMYTPAQYPTPPYYQYSYPPTATYYPQPPVPGAPTGAPAASAQPNPPTNPPPTIVPSTSQPTSTIPNTPTGTMVGNSGSWSDEETDRLRKLTEDSKSKSSSGDIEWDWVAQEWGPSRSRHQILLKATSIGLKGSSTRGVKRRREPEGPDAPGSAPPPPPAMSSLQSNSTNPPQGPSNVATPQQANTIPPVLPQPTQPPAPLQPPPNVMRMPSISSPAHTSSSTPAASPALQNQQRPPSSKGIPPPVTAASKLPWPMPTVAVNTPSPVITPSLTNPHEQRSSYYRPRPNQQELPPTASGPSMVPSQPTTHHFSMYPSNGLRPKENGK